MLLGTEATGLSRTLREAATTVVAVPMGGTASSLNVAAAHAVLLYEIDRQARVAGRRTAGAVRHDATPGTR